jgi:hypothetical protein
MNTSPHPSQRYRSNDASRKYSRSWQPEYRREAPAPQSEQETVVSAAVTNESYGPVAGRFSRSVLVGVGEGVVQMRRLTVCLAVIAVATVFGASAAVAGEGNVKKFCKANVAIDTAEEGPSDRQLERFRDTAPPEIAETVDAAVTQFEEEGEDAFEDEAFNALLAEVDQFVIDNCDYQQITVRMQDFAFEGLPEEIEKGTIAFSVLNEGEELHEFVVLRLKGDATLDDLLELPEDASEEDFGELASEVPGGGFAFPGDSDLALVKLKKTGTYVAICFIPVGTTPESGDEGGSGPPHFTEGMVTEFEVTS